VYSTVPGAPSWLGIGSYGDAKLVDLVNDDLVVGDSQSGAVSRTATSRGLNLVDDHTWWGWRVCCKHELI